MQAADAAFAAFPRCSYLACTRAASAASTTTQLSAMLVERDGAGADAPRPHVDMRRIVDRIGGGDAFAAGVLHGIRIRNVRRACPGVRTGAACIKHSIPGDFNLATREQVESLGAEGGFHVRR